MGARPCVYSSLRASPTGRQRIQGAQIVAECSIGESECELVQNLRTSFCVNIAQSVPRGSPANARRREPSKPSLSAFRCKLVPNYDYYCDANQRTVEVSHPASIQLSIWGEVCFVAQLPLGQTDPLAPVRRVLSSAPALLIQPGASELKNTGFTKLVRREEGVYENITASDNEARYMVAGDPSTLPKLHEKVRD